MPKQPTLAHFRGFSKTVVHRGEKIAVELPTEVVAKERKEVCPKCDKTFVNKQGLAVHLKCVHAIGKNDISVPNTSDENTETEMPSTSNSAPSCESENVSQSTTSDANDHEEIIASSTTNTEASSSTTNTDETSTEETTTSSADTLENDGAPKISLKRHAYTVTKKVEAIEMYESGKTQDEVNFDFYPLKCIS